MFTQTCSTCPACSACAPCTDSDKLELFHPVTFAAIERYVPKTKTAVAFSMQMLAAVVDSAEVLPDVIQDLGVLATAVIYEKIAAENFHAQLGERLLIELDRPGLLRYVLLCGQGGLITKNLGRCDAERALFNKRAFCAIFGLMAETASRHHVDRLYVAFEGLADRGVDLVGAAALLRCRCHHAVATNKIKLPEVVVICRYSERQAVEVGLCLTQQLCNPCDEPRLKKS
jgi:hypothetical protein